MVKVGKRAYMYGLPMPDDHRPGTRFLVTIEKINSPDERPYANPWGCTLKKKGEMCINGRYHDEEEGHRNTSGDVWPGRGKGK